MHHVPRPGEEVELRNPRPTMARVVRTWRSRESGFTVLQVMAPGGLREVHVWDLLDTSHLPPVKVL